MPGRDTEALGETAARSTRPDREEQADPPRDAVRRHQTPARPGAPLAAQASAPGAAVRARRPARDEGPARRRRPAPSPRGVRWGGRPGVNARPAGCGRVRRSRRASRFTLRAQAAARTHVGTTTATITTGMTFRCPCRATPSRAASRSAGGSASRRTSPMPIARRAPARGREGLVTAMPAAAPMNSAGKTGPPRKLDSDRA